MFHSGFYSQYDIVGYLEGKPDDAKTIILDEFPITSFTGLPLQRFYNLRCLSANACGLTSVVGLPLMPNLTFLQLNDNRLGFAENNPQLAALARTTPNLKRLTLANNGIITVQQLEPLKNLPALRTVDLYSNTVTRAHHRQLVLAVPQVVRWDGDGGDFE
ncbi:acidic leucine-rich nuclear phosphoprotein 32 family member B-like [Paramacrobiotus metropolitanus]|uniref:acidic leucine-rich nuclear phosphoprotein 32 family member B-like n=1 Tax=Paramacrobiotus metropolitanus TaxID=2943436 RepID=UPI0024464A8D|nr:acidic leucine-rich nuclear phosphoprotein 32 family member B-like [Paramacrobiotus metropolitanus]